MGVHAQNNIRLFLDGKLAWGASALKHSAHLPQRIEAHAPPPPPPTTLASSASQRHGADAAPGHPPPPPVPPALRLDPQAARARLHELGTMLDGCGLLTRPLGLDHASKASSTLQPLPAPPHDLPQGATPQPHHHWALQTLVRVLAQLLAIERECAH